MLHIVKVRVERSNVLSVEFSDGTAKTVDVGPLLEGPVFEPLRDPEYFAKVTLDPIFETAIWPNGADLAPEALYGLADLGDGPKSERSDPDGTWMESSFADP